MINHQQTSADTLQQLGQLEIPKTESNFIHNHRDKLRSFDYHRRIKLPNIYIIPQLVAIEQNPKIEGLLIILNTVGVM